MIALALALALVAQEPAAPPAGADAPMATAEPAPRPEPAAPDPAPAEAALPTGAPRDDYGLVGWCLGALEGYVAQHDRVMPDVTRIESTYRRPGSSLSDDLRVYADQQVQARAHLKSFAAALQAAEKASLSSLRPKGEATIAKGRAVWAPAANLPTRTVAQQWMGWTLPQACPAAAERLTRNAALLGAAFDPAAEAIAAPAQEPTPPQPGAIPAAAEAGAPAPAPAETVPEAAPTSPPGAQTPESPGTESPRTETPKTDVSAPATDAAEEAPFEAPAPDSAPALRQSPGLR